MLRITSIDGDGRRTLVLEGRLVEPWVVELEKLWEDTRQANGSLVLTVDLKDVTAISERGEDLLRRMIQEGARFNCCRGVLTRHVVRRLIQRWAGQGKKEM